MMNNIDMLKLDGGEDASLHSFSARRVQAQRLDRRAILTGLACLAGLSVPSSQPAEAAGGLSGLIGANRVTAVNFWASWCPPCVAEMAGFDSVYRQMRARGVGIVGVNNKESAATVSAFVRRRGISYPIVLDPDGSLVKSYGVDELPATFIVDQQGRVRRSFTGDVTAASLRAKLESVLRDS